MLGHSKIFLSRYETKVVRRKIRGKTTRVRVHYWHLRYTVGMSPTSSGMLSARVKLPYSGKWHMYVHYFGTGDYAPSSSTTVGFSVK